jgi:putative ABC transport system permease protein
MTFSATVAMALNALQVKKLRTALTALGVIIGVGAVVTMMAIGAGAQALVAEQIRSLGSNLIMVLSGSITSGGLRLGSGSQLTITEDDARAIQREGSNVDVAAPIMRGAAQVVFGNANWSTALQGVTPEYFRAREWDVVAGRLVTQEDLDAASKVVLLGQTVVDNLFGRADPVGQSIRIKKVPFIVVGILARKGQSTQGQDQDDTIVIPLSTAKKKVLGVSQANARAVGSILIKARDTAQMKASEQQIRDLLRQRHHIQQNEGDDFAVRNLSEILESQQAASRVLSLLLAATTAA